MVEPKPSSTVALLRDSAAGLETYLMRRHSRMSFVGGAHVFPGGGVDATDHDPSIPWAGPSVDDWAVEMECTSAEALSYVVAAVRETFEETGVLLAGPDAGPALDDVSGDDWELARLALEKKDLSLAELLRQRDLVLRSDLLRYWSRRVTPAGQPKRYDTRFFVASIPDGQTASNVTSEAEDVEWAVVADAVARGEAEEILLVYPTMVTCRQIAAFSSLEAVLASVGPQPRLEVL